MKKQRRYLKVLESLSEDKLNGEQIRTIVSSRSAWFSLFDLIRSNEVLMLASFQKVGKEQEVYNKINFLADIEQEIDNLIEQLKKVPPKSDD